MNSSCWNEVSSNFLTRSLWIVDQGDSAIAGNAIFAATVVSLYLIVGGLLNCVVIVLLRRSPCWKSPFLVLLVNLVLSNIIPTILIFPFIMVAGFTGEFKFGSTDAVRCGVCKIGAVNVMYVFVSLITISLLCVDRWIYLLNQFWYSKYITPFRALLASIMVWLLSIFLSVSPYFGYGSIQFNNHLSSCVPEFAEGGSLVPNFYYTIAISGFAMFPAITIMVMSMGIVGLIKRMALLRRRREKILVDSFSGNSFEKLESITWELNMTRLLGGVLVTYAMSWLLLLILIIVEAVRSKMIPPIVWSLAYLLLFSVVITHPMLEITMIRNTMKSLKCHKVEELQEDHIHNNT